MDVKQLKCPGSPDTTQQVIRPVRGGGPMVTIVEEDEDNPASRYQHHNAVISPGNVQEPYSPNSKVTSTNE